MEPVVISPLSLLLIVTSLPVPEAERAPVIPVTFVIRMFPAIEVMAGFASFSVTNLDPVSVISPLAVMFFSKIVPSISVTVVPAVTMPAKYE